MIENIHSILKNSSYSDFDIVEEIIRVFVDNGIDCGSCHDF